MRALRESLTRLSWETMPSVLFPDPALIRFTPERATCDCGERLLVQKTRRKKILTLLGPFIAHETVAQCELCSRTFPSDPLLRLVGPRCNVAFDVLVFVGEALFRRHRNTREVRCELIARNVRLSISEIEYLGRKFVINLAAAHQRATPRIRRAMELSGGYILHLDAMHEGEAPALMSGMDSLRKFVLGNVKLPSEHADHIAPFLQKLKADYGSPIACVHDMGSGILKAVAQVFPGIRDFICHFHFLRDLGKDFLEPSYALIRSQLRSHGTASRLHALLRETRQSLGEHASKSDLLAKTFKDGAVSEDSNLAALAATYSLTLWVLHGKHSGDGYGFPFDRPLLDFAERLLDLYRRLPQLLDSILDHDEPDEQQAIWKLALEVSHVGNDSVLCRAVEELRRRSSLFDRLRKAMRIAPPHGANGLNDEGSDEAMSTIRQGVEAFPRELDQDPELASDHLCLKMAEQSDKYGDKLFADPLTVTTSDGPITLYPQRTNNILEQFFRGQRYAHRRKTGNDSMERALRAMLSDTPLIKNLDNPEYMKILLDGKANLEELFAEMGPAHLNPAEGSQADSDRILPGFRALMKLPTLPDQVLRSFQKHQEQDKSN